MFLSAEFRLISSPRNPARNSCVPSNIIVRAIIPAVLYFTGIYIAVHVEAKKEGLLGIPKEQLPKMSSLIKDIYLLIPIVMLIWLVSTSTRTIQTAAALSIVAAIIVSFPNKKYRMNLRGICAALAVGGKGCISVAAACGIAGIIAGTITMTGLANILINGIVAIAGNQVIIALRLIIEDKRPLDASAAALPEHFPEIFVQRVFPRLIIPIRPSVLAQSRCGIQLDEENTAVEGAVYHPQPAAFVIEQLGIDRVRFARLFGAVYDDLLVRIRPRHAVRRNYADDRSPAAEARRQRIIHIIGIADLFHVGRPGVLLYRFRRGQDGGRDDPGGTECPGSG